jgi:hypothetical protein
MSIKNKNRLPLLICAITTIIISVIFLAVATGNIGNYEVWRITCAFLGLLIYSGMTLLLIFRYK